MAFNQTKLDKSFNTSRNIFDKYVYLTDDAISVVINAGYFDSSRFISDPDWVGGLIECNCADGFIIAQIKADNGLSVLFDSTVSGSGMPIAPTGGQFLAEGAGWIDSQSTAGNSLFTYSANTSATDPTAGVVKFDNTDLNLVTQIYISSSSLDAISYDEIMKRLARSDQIIFTRYGANFNNVDFRVRRFAVDNGGWFTLEVAPVSVNGGFLDNDSLEIRLFEVGDRKADVTVVCLGDITIAEEEPNNPTILGQDVAGNSPWVEFGVPNGIEVDTTLGALRNVKGRTIDNMVGSISLQYQQDSGGNGFFYLASERSLDGITWTNLPNSVRAFRNGNNDSAFLATISGVSNWQDGEYVRFMAYTDGNAGELFTPTAIFNNELIQGFSVAWSLSEQ